MIINLSYKKNEEIESGTLRLSNPADKTLFPENLLGFPIGYFGKNSHMVSSTNENALDIRPGLVYNLAVGNYSALAHELHFLVDINHELNRVSISGTLPIPGLNEQPVKRKGQIIIQNDVWIGRGVTIMGGVTIHSGAMVAANATVTKDVPPYCVVGGVPAKPLKYRFSEDVIEKMLKIQWWDWSNEKILKNQKWFFKTPEEFADHFYPEALDRWEEAKKKPQPFEKLPHQYLFFSDLEDKFCVCPKVIREFCRVFQDRPDCGLVVFVPKSEEKVQVARIMKIVENVDAKCDLFLFVGKKEQEAAAFFHADALITGRSYRTVFYTSQAALHGMPVLSGVDIPIFQ